MRRCAGKVKYNRLVAQRGCPVFLNLSNDILGIGPRDGVTYQVSSYGRRTHTMPGIIGEFQKKCVDLKPGEPFEAADLEGPGVITRIWVTQPAPLNRGALRDVAVRMYWDGEDEPSVLVPLGDLFGATFARPVEYSSAYLSITSGAYLSFFPMPFRRRARIVFENQGLHPARLFFYQVTWLKLDREPEAGMPYFHCLWHREEPGRGDPPFTVLDTRGRGFYLGCHLDMQGAGFPWRPNPVSWQMPQGFGMGMLEGWERIWIDGAAEAAPNVHGTGGEDYFNGAWYFTHVPSTTLTHGVTLRSYAKRRVSCYRFHAEMPVAFNERIRVTIDHGLNNVLPARYDGSAYWYQEEPHAPMGELPPPGERRVGGTAAARITMSVPLLYGGALWALVRAVRRRRRDAVAEQAQGTGDRAC
jgi:D-arabinan exo alpha-(1,3)/(1,5)-arabinofuranosidase (non-reducing end)